MTAKSHSVALFMLLVVAACAAPSRQEDPGVAIEELGRFNFLVETREGTRVTGLIDVALDTIVARSESAPCRRATAQPDRNQLVYECAAPGTAGIRLSLDRRHPARNSKWAYFTPVVKARDVCTEYRTWEDGSRTCTRSTREEYVEQVWRSGELVVTR